MSKLLRSFDRQDPTSRLLTSTREEASIRSFLPRGAIRCGGLLMFRTQVARDVASLLDVDPSVISWTCLPMVLSHGDRRHVPDIAVKRVTGVSLLDAVPTSRNRAPPEWASEAAQALGYGYETHYEGDLRSNVRLENARDLLRYAFYKASLGDRVRILALLDEQGPMPLSACLQAVRNGHDPIGVIAALALHRFIEIELDEGHIGPDTLVSRFRC